MEIDPFTGRVEGASLDICQTGIDLNAYLFYTHTLIIIF